MWVLLASPPMYPDMQKVAGGWKEMSGPDEEPYPLKGGGDREWWGVLVVGLTTNW